MQGILVVDKPTGVTSHDVVAKARKVILVRLILWLRGYWFYVLGRQLSLSNI